MPDFHRRFSDTGGVPAEIRRLILKNGVVLSEGLVDLWCKTETFRVCDLDLKLRIKWRRYGEATRQRRLETHLLRYLLPLPWHLLLLLHLLPLTLRLLPLPLPRLLLLRRRGSISDLFSLWLIYRLHPRPIGKYLFRFGLFRCDLKSLEIGTKKVSLICSDCLFHLLLDWLILATNVGGF